MGEQGCDNEGDRKELELYFHIPFCIRKCLYCDFLSAPGDEETKRLYMEALLAETAGSASRYADYRVVSIFIGGGTPSAVSVSSIERLMETVGGNYHMAKEVEATIEVNPGTVTREGLERYRRAGLNRLSIGLQSADDAELAAIGRIHTWRQFTECFAAARKAGFRNINVDIMSALPGQKLSGYRNTLDRVLALEDPPEHISAYSLILEEGTPLYERYERGELKLPDEDTDRAMYRETKEHLERAGYHRYEISNYAKRGYECRHNCGYWRRRQYAGFGLGAASLVDNIRFQNGADLAAYLADPLGCRQDAQVLSLQEQMEEFMFLGLRLTAGVSFGEFRLLFGQGMEEIYGEVIQKNVRDGLLQVIPGFDNGAGREWNDRRRKKDKTDLKKRNTDNQGLGGRYVQQEYAARANIGKDSAEEWNVGEGDIVQEKIEKEDAGKEWPADNTDRLALTEKGLDVSNYVMAQFLLD